MNLSHKAKPVINFVTSRFGPLSITEDKIIYFVQAIPGFERLKRFILIDHDQEGVFKWLQSVEDPAVAFLLTAPNLYKPDYSVPMRKADLKALDVKDAQTVVTMVMVCSSKDQSQLSLNLKGPVVFNSANMTAVQCIIDSDEYQSHFSIKT